MRLLFLFFLFICINGYSQDLYDYRNSMKYAEHLKKSRRFDQAIQEYERLLFMQPSNDTIINNLSYCLNQSGYYHKTISLLDTIPRTSPEIRRKLYTAAYFEKEYDRIYALTGKEESKANMFFLPAAKAKQKMLSESVRLSDSLYLITKDQKLIALKAHTEQYMKDGRKSPLLAATLSLVPGAGKVYTKDYSDALVSFIMTGGLAFQAYRGFSKHGTKSAYGWIYGGLAVGFYTGNIYGSWKAAKKFNQKKSDAFDAKVRDLIISAD